ncbi:PREDICTED: anoctamin-9-like [Papilio xuthus]|uniref:Anoctamin n=1 Tax=Papilio xuthus TaxID=66420 RepID=A0AAJ7E832_PAPXU|nr:PREDICTED: anoctamin-9-like [Papilio xuthus]
MSDKPGKEEMIPMEALDGVTSDSKESTLPPKSNTDRTFRDGVRKIDLILVVKDEENVIGDTMRKDFLTNIVKMGFEIEYENGVLPIHKKLIFFKVHCPNDVLNNLGNAFGVKCLQIGRADHIMSHKERDWINVVRLQYTQPLQYSSLDRSLIVYMALLNLPFGNRQNYIGLERLIKRNIVIDAYALHDGPYFIPRDATSINARQILFYNWAGVTNIFTRQPLNLVHEYFGPKVAMYFAFYGLYNLFLVIASIMSLITLYLAIYKNPTYMNVKEEFCECEHHIFCLKCGKTLTYCYTLPVKNLCNIFSLNILVDHKYTPHFSAFIILWGIFMTAYWIGREKFLYWVWETPNKDYNRKQTRPEFKFNFDTAPRSRKTGIVLIGKTITAKIITLICYIILIVLAVIVCAIILEQRKKQDKNYMINNKIRDPDVIIPRIIHTMVGFALVLFVIGIIERKFAYLIVRRENHKNYKSISRSLIKHLYVMCFPLPMIVLGYFGFQKIIFKLYTGMEKHVTGGPPNSYNFGIFLSPCLVTSCLYELSIAFPIVLILRFVLLRKLSLYSSLTDYNQGTLVQNVPCWERDMVLPRFKEKFLINRMKILVMQFTLIMSFGFACPPAIVIVLFFNIYDMRRDAELCILHYRRPLLFKNKTFKIWTNILKLMVYTAIVLNVVSLVCSTDTIQVHLTEQREKPGNVTLDHYLGIFFRHEHALLWSYYYDHYACCNARGFPHVRSSNFSKIPSHKTMLTLDELRFYQYLYIFSFEVVMFAVFMLLQYIFSVDVDELEIPKKLIQQQRDAKTLQNITE